MTTVDPVRFVSCGIRNLPTVDEALASSSDVPQVLDLLLKEQRFNRNKKDAVPNRSGSAPPSIEGSFTALGSFSGPFHSVFGDELLSANIKDVHELEKQLRADPSYITYYFSNVNLNPRLPPPITSRETRHLAKNIGQLGKYWRYPSFDGNSEGSLFSSQALLSTHEEEDKDDSSLTCNLNGTEQASSGFQSAQSGTPEGRRENLVGLIEEVLPRTPTPLSSNHSHSASHGLGEIVVDSEAQVNPLQDFHSITFQAASPRVCAGNAAQSGHSVIPTLKANPSVSTVSSMPSSSISRHECAMGELNMHSNSQNPRQHSRKTTLDQQSSAFQCHASTSHTKSQSQEVHLTHNMTAKVQPILSSVDGKQSFEPAGYYPYVGSTGYTHPGNSLYPNLLASSLFAPQYGLGKYAAAATISPPFSVGYPPPGAICMDFGGPMSISPIGAGEFFSSNADIQHKFHGQLGVSVQLSSFPSLYLPYFEQPPIDVYGAFGQSVVHNYNLQEPPPLTAYSIDQLSCPRSNAAVSPAVGTIPIRRTENIRLQLNSSRTNGLQGSRGRERINTKVCSFLEELKSSKNCKFELSDIIGHVIEFSTDQHGSRFIQQKLENCCVEEKAHVFEEVHSHAPMLMTDVFGNYVVQKLFEHGDEGQRKELANQLIGRILPLSLQMYGCRVIQKALEVIEDDQKKRLALELKGHVLQCVRDQNGNHVIQKCIQCVPTDQIGFVISAFQGQVATLSMHPYGCRVIQRVLENCTDKSQCQSIVNEILHSACLLAQDQYGNYVTQHVLERGKPQERSQIITNLAGQIIHLSQNKYASNVIEKCLEHGDSAERDLLIEEIVGQTDGNENLLVMMKDQYANYVIQKILETCSGKQYNILLFQIKAHLQALKYTYGKHIVARVEGLFSEESGASSQ